jgi:hypothetical protein
MAKMFYTLDEAKAALGRSEDEIKQFAREGRLREFRDGPRLMFKADQVEQLRGELGAGGDTVDLGVSDSGGMIGLVDTTGASGTSITLAEADTGMGGDSPSGTGTGMRLKDDTVAGDVGLSGSLGGVPSPVSRSGGSLGGASLGGTGIPLAGSTAGGTGIPLAATGAGGTALGGTGHAMTSGGSAMGVSASGLSGSMSGRSRGGVNVFGSDDIGLADPSAQTAISGMDRNQGSGVNLETVGSGSGLLDLTRESDDTSLGSVLDEIGPAGATRTGPAIGGTEVGGSALADIGQSAVDRRPLAAPVMVQQLDRSAPAFAGAAIAGFAAVLFAAFILISTLMGAVPRDLVKQLTDYGLLVIAGIGLGVALLFFGAGWFAGKTVKG